MGGSTGLEEDFGVGGGGRIWLEIEEALEVNETIDANGGNGGRRGGDGSSGSIYILATNFAHWHHATSGGLQLHLQVSLCVLGLSPSNCWHFRRLRLRGSSSFWPSCTHRFSLDSALSRLLPSYADLYITSLHHQSTRIYSRRT